MAIPSLTIGFYLPLDRTRGKRRSSEEPTVVKQAHFYSQHSKKLSSNKRNRRNRTNGTSFWNLARIESISSSKCSSFNHSILHESWLFRNQEPRFFNSWTTINAITNLNESLSSFIFKSSDLFALNNNKFVDCQFVSWLTWSANGQVDHRRLAVTKTQQCPLSGQATLLEIPEPLDHLTSQLTTRHTCQNLARFQEWPLETWSCWPSSRAGLVKSFF